MIVRLSMLLRLNRSFSHPTPALSRGANQIYAFLIIRISYVAQQQVRVGKDDAQQIIEVVCDA